jgi:hypothetical protein
MPRNDEFDFLGKAFPHDEVGFCGLLAPEFVVFAGFCLSVFGSDSWLLNFFYLLSFCFLLTAKGRHVSSTVLRVFTTDGCAIDACRRTAA